MNNLFIEIKGGRLHANSYRHASKIAKIYYDYNSHGSLARGDKEFLKGGDIYENDTLVAHVNFRGNVTWANTVLPVHFYAEFSDIEVPRVLDNDDWEDVSFGNDLTARSKRIQPSASGKMIEVWVYAFVENQRDMPSECLYRYVACLFTEDSEEPINSIDCNTSEELLKAIAELEKE